MTRKESNIMLLSITLCWASSYLVIKEIPDSLSSFAYLTLTSGIAGIILLCIYSRRLKSINSKVLSQAFFLSFLLIANILFEKEGLDYLPSSSASFFESLNIVFVPLILIFLKKFPSKNTTFGIIIILIGLVISNIDIFSSGNETDLAVQIQGIIYILGACIAMSLYTVISTNMTKEADPMCLTALQMTFSGLIGLFLWFIDDPYTFANVEWSDQLLSYIFILAFFAKAYAYSMLMYAEKYTDAISVAVIASTEPIVTLFMAAFLPGLGMNEIFSMKSFIGALVIASGAVIANLDFSSLSSELSKLRDDKKIPLIDERNLRHLSFTQQFFIIFIPFVVIASSFKVMKLIPGLTEVRPEGAFNIVAGLIFGPAGALACMFGNLAADLFGTLSYASIFGMIANFIAAYMPYKIWWIVSNERPNAHTWKNIAIYVLISFISAFLCAWILLCGVRIVFGTWIDFLFSIVFNNNFIFSVILGLPLFILAESDSMNIAFVKPSQRFCFNFLEGRTIICMAFIIPVIAVISLFVCLGHYYIKTYENLLFFLTVVLFTALWGILFAPAKKESKN